MSTLDESAKPWIILSHVFLLSAESFSFFKYWISTTSAGKYSRAEEENKVMPNEVSMSRWGSYQVWLRYVIDCFFCLFV